MAKRKRARTGDHQGRVTGQLGAAAPRPTPSGRALPNQSERAVRAGREIVVEPGYGEAWRVELHNERVRIRTANEHIEAIIARAIAAGATWSGVARSLGMSRQWAYKKYRHLRPVVAPVV